MAAFHFLAGSVAGAIFAIRTLLVLVGLVLLECIGAAIAFGTSAGFWLLGSLVAIQIGYLTGVYLRDVFELARATQSSPGRNRHL